jgi:hypothetical protein
VKLKLSLLPLLLILIAGCGGTKQVYELASTPPQYAKSVLLHHNAIGEQIADLREDPAVSDSTKAKLLEGYRLTVCSADERAQAVVTGACKAGPAQRTEAAGMALEKLRSATTETELQAAVDALVSELVKLIDLVSGVK